MQKTKTQPKPPFPAQDTGPRPGLEQHMSPRPRYKALQYRAARKLEGQVALITGGDSGKFAIRRVAVGILPCQPFYRA